VSLVTPRPVKQAKMTAVNATHPAEAVKRAAERQVVRKVRGPLTAVPVARRARQSSGRPDRLAESGRYADGMEDSELVAVIDAAMAAVRGDPYGQSLTDPDNEAEDGPGDGMVRYYGSIPETGYPGRPCPLLEANLGEETIPLASGDLADYSTMTGRLSSAALIAGHRTASRPTLAQVRALAAEIAAAEERDGGGEFRLTGDEVDDILGAVD
jgi:hypothetical protein